MRKPTAAKGEDKSKDFRTIDDANSEGVKASAGLMDGVANPNVNKNDENTEIGRAHV